MSILQALFSFYLLVYPLKVIRHSKKKELVVKAVDFFVIAGKLYKMGSNEVIHRYVPEYERHSILAEARGVLLEDTMQERQLRRRSYEQDYGGRRYIKIRRSNVVHVMYVKVPGDHHEGMNFP